MNFTLVYPLRSYEHLLLQRALPWLWVYQGAIIAKAITEPVPDECLDDACRK